MLDSLDPKEKVALLIMSLLVVLLAVGIAALLLIPATAKMSPEDAIAKWRTPIGTAGLLSFLCDEALVAAETPGEERMAVQFGIAAVVYPMLIGASAALQQWRPLPDQEELKGQIRDEAATLTTLVKLSAEKWENDTSAGGIADQCQDLTTLEATIIKRARADGATEADIHAVLSEDLEIEE